LPEHVKHLGWDEDKIILIDEDEGVSGTLRIDERAGMSRLYHLIISGEIGAVASINEDRFFRDESQIEPNKFIAACRDNEVLVITPTMIYDFEQAYHRKQFRFVAEMAAEYIEHQIRGRLHTAKERKILQGRWGGYGIPMGYIIDNRKKLDDGSLNPDYHKYVVYEPVAEVVREYFRLFLRYGGNVRQTERHIRKHGPTYPPFKDIEAGIPDGFRFVKPPTLQSDRVDRGGLRSMLVNATYIGHWIYKNQVVIWNNHPALLDEETFFSAFNYLSPETLDGQPNADYSPIQNHARPSLEANRQAERPLLEGLITTLENGEPRKVTVRWIKPYRCYGYHCASRYPEYKEIWHKRAVYIDEAFSDLLKDKLSSTFKTDSWEKISKQFSRDFVQERYLIETQLQSVEGEMTQLVANISQLTIPQLIAKTEEQYLHYEAEQSRLQSKLVELNQEANQLELLDEIRNTCDSMLENWDKLNREDKRRLIQVFVSAIEASPLPKQAVHLKIIWKDGSSDEFDLARKGSFYIGWMEHEVELLVELLESNVPQIEVAKAFPSRKWYMIRNKVYSMDADLNFEFSPKPIQDTETFDDYLRRTDGGTKRHQAGNAERWHSEDIERLRELVNDDVEQIELCRAFPHRTWNSIRSRITKLYGKDKQIKGKRIVRRYESYNAYQYRLECDGEGEDEGGEKSMTDTTSEVSSATNPRSDTSQRLLPTKRTPKSNGANSLTDTTSEVSSKTIRRDVIGLPRLAWEPIHHRPNPLD
jgi:DNA invertase Pin-like site-specific DNA recombinase